MILLQILPLKNIEFSFYKKNNNKNYCNTQLIKLKHVIPLESNSISSFYFFFRLITC